MTFDERLLTANDDVLQSARYYRQVAARGESKLGEHVVGSIYSHTSKLTFFYSNVYSENLFWERALHVFADAFRPL